MFGKIYIHRIMRVLFFLGLLFFFSFTIHSDQNNYGITIKKTIKKVGNHLYQVAIEFDNRDVINGIAKYEAKLPLSADFVKEVSRDKTVNFKVDKRKIKIIWMHIRNNNSYSTVFQLKSNRSINKLKMVGDFYGHKDGHQFTLKDTTSFLLK